MTPEILADQKSAFADELELMGETVTIGGHTFRGILTETDESLTLGDYGEYQSPKNAALTLSRADGDRAAINTDTVILARGIRWRAISNTVRTATLTLEITSRDADD